MITSAPTTTRTILGAIARFARKAIRFVFKTIAVAALATIILAIVLPPAAFVWRSTLPMNDPLFNGLSFYQVIQLRNSQYRVSVARFNATHLNAKYAIPPEVCSWSEVARSITVSASLAEICTLAKCSGLVVVPTGLETYPAAIWSNFEYNLVYEFKRAQQQPAAACRLSPFFPSLEDTDIGN